MSIERSPRMIGPQSARLRAALLYAKKRRLKRLAIDPDPDLQTFTFPDDAASVSNFKLKGNRVSPNSNRKLKRISFRTDAANVSVFVFEVSPDNTATIQNILFSSSAFASLGTTLQEFVFPTAPILVAGTHYAVCIYFETGIPHLYYSNLIPVDGSGVFNFHSLIRSNLAIAEGVNIGDASVTSSWAISLITERLA